MKNGKQNEEERAKRMVAATRLLTAELGTEKRKRRSWDSDMNVHFKSMRAQSTGKVNAAVATIASTIVVRP